MIAYLSRTGNVRAIVHSLNYPMIEISDGLLLSGPFVLCTYTDGLGDVPKKVEQFMAQNYTNCIGVIASGNRNFGQNFAKAADVLATRYNIPIVAKLDLRGQTADFAQIQNFLIQNRTYV